MPYQWRFGPKLSKTAFFAPHSLHPVATTKVFQAFLGDKTQWQQASHIGKFEMELELVGK